MSLAGIRRVGEPTVPGATVDARAELRRDRALRRRRNLAVCTGAATLVAALVVVTLTMSSVRLTLRQVILSMAGQIDNAAINFIVLQSQWPRAKSALAVGLALGVAGTLMQQLLRNQLASPDFVGVSAGASFTAVTGIVLLGSGGLGIPVLALIGGLTSAVLMYVLAWRDGVKGYRFILIGIGVSLFFEGLVGFMLARTDRFEARAALHWLTGSVGMAGDSEVTVLLVALAVLVPAGVAIRRGLTTLQLGDDSARVLGTPVETARLALLLVSVTLTALATAVAGPLVFVALIAGPVANRLLGRASGGLFAAGAVGAVLVLTSDYVAMHLLPVALPTGVITGAVGAPYLLWLLATSNREGAGS